MRTLLTLTVIIAALVPASAILAKPFETQSQIEAQHGSRAYNGEETSEYKIIGYSTSTMLIWVLFIGGISEGELYFPGGPMADMEVASHLEANKGQSIWQAEKVLGFSKGGGEKMWSRKDGKLYAYMERQGNQGILMIGTKRAQRIMGDMKKWEAMLKLRDRIQ